MWIRKTSLVFPVTLVVLSVCSISAGSRVRSTVNLSELVAGAAPEGWELYDEILQFTPENLYEQIDGRAELYLSYNVVGLTYSTFDSRHEPGLSINLSVYDMGTPLNAFGVFSVERTTGETPIGLGREGYCSGANYYVWKGQYYIQAIALQEGIQAQKAALEMARRVTKQLPDSGDEVWGFKVFPPKGLVKDSFRFFLVDALGLDFMQNTFTALYRKDGTEIATFISRRASQQEAVETLRRYARFGNRYGVYTQTINERGTEFLVCQMKRGYDVVTTKGSYLIGVTAAPGYHRAVENVISLYGDCCMQP